jgi:CO dehydrogenase nickel-insertion accessory protein CooC1
VGKKIGLYGKGGSGKSTAAVLLARALSHRYTVCLLDADSTNLGMHRALGLDSSPKPLLDYFGGMVFSGGAVRCPVDDPTPLQGAELALDRLPAPYFSRSEEGILLMTAGKIGGLGLRAGCDGPIARITRDLEVHLVGDEEPVMLVDFKAGFEDTARGVITGLDWILAVVDPTTAAIEMVYHLRKTISQVQAGASPATAHIEDPALAEIAERLCSEARVRGMLAVLNRVADKETEAYLRKKLLDKDISPVAGIPYCKEINTAWLRGERLPAHLATEEAEAVISELEASERENQFTVVRTVPN